jgi:integrase
VAVQFHKWCQRNDAPTPLGAFLEDPSLCGRTLAPRVIRRHPRLLGMDEVRALLSFVRPTYKLAFRWALVTGLRRFELAMLRCSVLPRPETLPFQEDGLAKVQINRKGGRELTAYVPISLVEETQWYVITERCDPCPGFEDYLFIGRRGRPLSRTSLSREFRRCADLIGSDATLHHLRHTYAVNVLRLLDKTGSEKVGNAKNSLKTLQVLMGHSRCETTEIYLRAMDVTSEAVVNALGYLYGASV